MIRIYKFLFVFAALVHHFAAIERTLETSTELSNAVSTTSNFGDYIVSNSRSVRQRNVFEVASRQRRTKRQWSYYGGGYGSPYGYGGGGGFGGPCCGGGGFASLSTICCTMNTYSPCCGSSFMAAPHPMPLIPLPPPLPPLRPPPLPMMSCCTCCMPMCAPTCMRGGCGIFGGDLCFRRRSYLAKAVLKSL